MSYKLQDVISTYLEEHARPLHLDIGNRSNLQLGRLTRRRSDVVVTAYDPDLTPRSDLRFRDTEWAKRIVQQSYLHESLYDSGSALFAYHNQHDLFSEMKHYLKRGAPFIVADYQMKGLNLEQFAFRFTSVTEQEEMHEMGLREAYEVHTAKNLADCVEESANHGFKTLDYRVVDRKFFVWLGTKL